MHFETVVADFCGGDFSTLVVDPTEVECLPQDFPRVRSLYIIGDRYAEISAEALEDAIRQLKYLTALTISGIYMDNDTYVSICLAVKDTTIQYLAFNSDCLHKSVIRELLTSNSHIRTLDLSHGEWASGKFQKFCDVLATRECRLTCLNLSENRISHIAALAKALETNESLQAIDLSYNDIEDVGLLFQSLTRNRTLRCLNLKYGYSNLSAQDFLNLAKNNTLTRLDISNYYNGQMNSSRIPAYIKLNTAMTHLYINTKKSSTATLRQVQNIADALSYNSTLRVLRLGNSQIEQDIKCQISDSLCDTDLTPKLQSLAKLNALYQCVSGRNDYPQPTWLDLKHVQMLALCLSAINFPLELRQMLFMTLIDQKRMEIMQM